MFDPFDSFLNVTMRGVIVFFINVGMSCSACAICVQKIWGHYRYLAWNVRKSRW